MSHSLYYIVFLTFDKTRTKFSNPTFDFLEKDNVELVLFQISQKRIEKNVDKVVLTIKV